jgi:hypothetical protein
MCIHEISGDGMKHMRNKIRVWGTAKFQVLLQMGEMVNVKMLQLHKASK